MYLQLRYYGKFKENIKVLCILKIGAFWKKRKTKVIVEYIGHRYSCILHKIAVWIMIRKNNL